ncbi:TetR/AcrR family transcriptional regulator [Pedomonas mirosovicensis]|uniref:TetR/AcrR family transcriptional regulator n=1 Tax=Pedomonas mirosovicensis TaxID=2908641 RepID=UPI0035BBDEB1
MTTRGRGRPSGGTESVSPAKILSEALGLLDSKGLEGLTMRALAMRVGISPMTIYHHFQDRDGLIRALGDMVYSDVDAPPGGMCPIAYRGAVERLSLEGGAASKFNARHLYPASGFP